MISGVNGNNALNSYAALQSPPVQAPKQPAGQASTSAFSVNISPQAQKLASDGDTQAQEVKESGAEKSAESFKGKA